MWDFGKYKEKIAIITEHESYTYEKLNTLQKEIVTYVDSRTLMFIMCENCIECLIGYIAAIENKVVPVMLSKDLSSEKYIELIKKYKPEYIWCKKIFNVKSWLKKSEKLDFRYEYKSYRLYRVAYELNDDEKLYNQLALMLSTSGSTGSPKYVRISYENLTSNTKSIVRYLNILPEDVTITTLPMNYSYGLSIINTYLYVGATIVLNEDSIIKRSFWDKLDKHKVTSISGVPYTYDLIKRMKLNKHHLPNLRILTQAGGKLSAETRKYLLDYCEKEKKQLIVMYGQTEATARMSYMPYQLMREKEESIGRPIPGGCLWIADNDGKKILDAYMEGEIVYEGDNVTLGYAMSRDDLAKGDERKKILYTGDMGCFDKDYFFYISDRKDRQAKLFGNRIDMEGIEREITSKYGGKCLCNIQEYNVYIHHSAKNVAEDVCGFVGRLLNIPNKNINYYYVENIQE